MPSLTIILKIKSTTMAMAADSLVGHDEVSTNSFWVAEDSSKRFMTIFPPICRLSLANHKLTHINMTLMAVIFAAVFALSVFTFAETAANVGIKNLENSKNGLCSPDHRQRLRCCGCPQKGAIYKVKVLNDIFLEFLFRGNQKMENFVDIPQFEADVFGYFGPDYCCVNSLDFPEFYDWLRGYNYRRIYAIYEQGRSPYESHDGCVVVPFDMIVVLYTETKDIVYSPTDAFKAKAIWCPAEGCNWKVDRMELQNYACLNSTVLSCPLK
jgi:hypothetical protein